MTAPRPTPREVAIDALIRVDDGAYANVLLPGLLRTTRMEQRERAQTTELVYGTLRRRRSVDALLEPVLDRDLDDLDAPVRAALRLGAYQLVEGVAPHAAVGETVGALARTAPHAKGYANAVLRRVAALGPPWPWPEGDSVTAVGVRTSMPDWIVARVFEDLGVDDGRGALELANEPAALTLRVNPRRSTVADVAAELVGAGATVEPGALLPDALIVRGGGDPGQLAAVADGRATPQDQGSQAVAAAVGALPGERVLEVGAAPGGKATALAEAMDDRGSVAAVDSNAGRLALVQRAATRLGLTAVTPIAADGRRLPFRAAAFDRVLLDAPCSGFGVLRRRPEARWRIEPDSVDELATLQRELLAAAATMVRPGGRLVFSVCTLTRAETIAVDDWARGALPGFVAEPPPGVPWRAWGRGALLLPQAAGTDGMYVLTLSRSPGGPR
ncbi:MAG: transcription antitermination factor NusB [Acidimicrobiia bacterium]